MIYLFTDFGFRGPYVGELHAVFKRRLANIPVIDLMHDAPAFNPKASSYLLAALAQQFQVGDLCLAVVDPGVGMPQRRALLIEADGVAYCGPDNGLFSQVVQHAQQVHCNEITWRPTDISESFHGRDLFAPVAVRYLEKSNISMRELDIADLEGMEWPDDLHEVIYFDQFGNTVTGIRASNVNEDIQLRVNSIQVHYAKTFAAVPQDAIFWYGNSMGLIEFAVNQGSVREKLSLFIGSPISVVN